MTDPELDLQEQIARIDYIIAETQKFAAEQRKIALESYRNHERWLLLTAAVSGIAAFLIACIAIAMHMGWLH